MSLSPVLMAPLAEQSTASHKERQGSQSSLATSRPLSLLLLEATIPAEIQRRAPGVLRLEGDEG